MSKLKVLFIARKFPPSVGGMERFASELSQSLDEKVILHVNAWGGSNKWLPLALPLLFIRSVIYLAKNRDTDIVHVQDAVQAPFGWLLSRIFNKPYIVVVHGLDITYDKYGYQKLIVPFVKKADAVVSISSATKEQVDFRGVEKTRSKVIGLGVNDDFHNKKRDKSLLAEKVGKDLASRKILLTTGRLVERKGVNWFIKNVLPELAKKDESILYIVVGTGEAKDTIIQSIENNNLTDNVLMMGSVSDGIRTLLYLGCDLFVMPNIKVKDDMEGFGIVAIEAALSGATVVASGIEGIKDAIFDGKNGILLNSENVDEFVEVIEKYLNNEKLRFSFGSKARDYTQNTYSWTSVSDKYVKIYTEIVEKK